MTGGADNWRVVVVVVGDCGVNAGGARVVIAADPNGTETRRKNANPLKFNELAFL